MMKNQQSGRKKMHRPGITSISEVYKLRKVVERIEKKLDKAFKILDNDTKGI